MENQHRAITGYGELDAEEIALMNEIKQAADKIGDLCLHLRGNSNCDQRWVAIGQTDLQKGFMALVRSVAKPTSF